MSTGAVRSLRTHLALAWAAALAISLGGTSVLSIGGARARVQAEVSSSFRLGRLLLRSELQRVAREPDPGAAFDRLGADLPRLHHLRFAVVSSDMRLLSRDPAGKEPVAAPAWFVALFGPPPSVETVQAEAGTQVLGRIDMISRPQDELGEIWTELQWELIASVCLVVGAGLLCCLPARRALRSLAGLTAGLDRLARGDTGPGGAPVAFSELHGLSEALADLTALLRRERWEQNLVIKGMTALREAERTDVARTLGEHIGPMVAGLHADVAGLLAAADGGPDEPRVMRAFATSIAGRAGGLRQSCRRILHRLHPVAPDRLRLKEELERLADEWRNRYPSISIALDLDPDFDSIAALLGLALYRSVQECLSNVVRHAGATTVSITLRRHSVDGVAGVELAVRDDGCGFSSPAHLAFGLLSLRAQARSLGGAFEVSGGAAAGASVAIWLPLSPAPIVA